MVNRKRKYPQNDPEGVTKCPYMEATHQSVQVDPNSSVKTELPVTQGPSSEIDYRTSCETSGVKVECPGTSYSASSSEIVYGTTFNLTDVKIEFDDSLFYTRVKTEVNEDSSGSSYNAVASEFDNVIVSEADFGCLDESKFVVNKEEEIEQLLKNNAENNKDASECESAKNRNEFKGLEDSEVTVGHCDISKMPEGKHEARNLRKDCRQSADQLDISTEGVEKLTPLEENISSKHHLDNFPDKNEDSEKENPETEDCQAKDSSSTENEITTIDYNNEEMREEAQESDYYHGRESSCTGEEMLGLREFDVLDEFDNNEDEEDQDDYNQSDFDSDVPDEEIEAMLEEGLPEEFKKKIKNDENESKDELPYKERKKVVLEELDHNHFEMLPDGWVQVNHNSGMPIFLHKQSRVCTLSKPYFLGPGSARKHEIPLSAIPCLQYRRALEAKAAAAKANEEKQAKEGEETSTGENPIAEAGFPNASIETIQENKAQQSLTATHVREYCEKLFQFKTVKVLRFKSWSERRKYTKQRKQEKQLQRPTLPEGTKLIKFPIQNSGCRENGHPKKEWIMNPNGKSYVCILHEYVQHALKKQPSYKFKELENAGTPYSATVSINDMQYGVGFGTSKKQAKSEAAKATLEILIPEMREKIQANEKSSSKSENSSDSYLSIFDEIKIEDPRVAELCAKTTEPSPYAILLTCLQRNFGSGEMNIKYEVNTLRHQRNEFMMTVGRHTARVICKNKRDGKQRASQSILQALHPHITSWGSLLRLYGSRSVKSMKEKKQEEQEITLLQSKAAINSPNIAILTKLKTEMKKIRDRRASVQPIGKFIPPDDVDLPSSSGADLNNVDL